jgi:hypothetical protein
LLSWIPKLAVEAASGFAVSGMSFFRGVEVSKVMVPAIEFDCGSEDLAVFPEHYSFRQGSRSSWAIIVHVLLVACGAQIFDSVVRSHPISMINFGGRSVSERHGPYNPTSPKSSSVHRDLDVSTFGDGSRWMASMLSIGFTGIHCAFEMVFWAYSPFESSCFWVTQKAFKKVIEIGKFMESHGNLGRVVMVRAASVLSASAQPALCLEGVS